MIILFGSEKLEALCSDERKMKQKLNKAGAKKLKRRLADLRTASCVAELVAGRPHPLARDREGQYAVDIDGGCRLVFEPAMDEAPLTEEGKTDWKNVSAVCIVYIGDYHD